MSDKETLTDVDILTFKAISNFTKELCTEFASKQRSLALYCRLVDKTTFSHEAAILKHIACFKNFCLVNREALKNKDFEKLSDDVQITYSSKVFINIKSLFPLSDADTQDAMWSHLLTISALVDPMGGAKSLLRQQGESKDTNEEIFQNIVDTIQTSIKPGTNNPMEAIQHLMSSGAINNIINTMETQVNNGTLDIGKMFGMVGNLVKDIEPGDNSNPMLTSMLTSLTGAMGSMDLEAIKKN